VAAPLENLALFFPCPQIPRSFLPSCVQGEISPPPERRRNYLSFFFCLSFPLTIEVGRVEPHAAVIAFSFSCQRVCIPISRHSFCLRNRHPLLAKYPPLLLREQLTQKKRLPSLVDSLGCVARRFLASATARVVFSPAVARDRPWGQRPTTSARSADILFSLTPANQTEDGVPFLRLSPLVLGTAEVLAEEPDFFFVRGFKKTSCSDLGEVKSPLSFIRD